MECECEEKWNVFENYLKWFLFHSKLIPLCLKMLAREKGQGMNITQFLMFNTEFIMYCKTHCCMNMHLEYILFVIGVTYATTDLLKEEVRKRLNSKHFPILDLEQLNELKILENM